MTLERRDIGVVQVYILLVVQNSMQKNLHALLKYQQNSHHSGVLFVHPVVAS